MSDISIIDLSKPIKTSEIKGKIVQMSRSDFIDLLLGSGLSDNYLQEAIEELEQENKELKEQLKQAIEIISDSTPNICWCCTGIADGEGCEKCPNDYDNVEIPAKRKVWLDKIEKE